MALSLSIGTNLVDTRLGDGDLAAGLAAASALGLDGLDDVHAVNDLAEDDVLAVELWLAYFIGDQHTQLVTTVVMNCKGVSTVQQTRYVRTASRWC